MIQLTIIFKNSNITLPLYFKAYKKADEASKKLSDLMQSWITGKMPGYIPCELEDDYGTFAKLCVGDISGIALVDLYKEMDRQGEFSVMQAVAQQKAQQNYQATAGSKILKPVSGMPLAN